MNLEVALTFLEQYQQSKNWKPNRTFSLNIAPVDTELYISILREYPVSELKRGWHSERIIEFATSLSVPPQVPKRSIIEEDYMARKDIFLDWDRTLKACLINQETHISMMDIHVVKFHVLEASMGIYTVETDSNLTFYLCSRQSKKWDELLMLFYENSHFQISYLQSSERKFILAANKHLKKV